MKVIRILNAQPVKIPMFKSLLTRKQSPAGDPIFLLHSFNVHIMNLDYAKYTFKHLPHARKGY